MISIAFKQVHGTECYLKHGISIITTLRSVTISIVSDEHFVLKARHWKSLIAPLHNLQFMTGKRMNAILVTVATHDKVSRMSPKTAIRK